MQERKSVPNGRLVAFMLAATLFSTVSVAEAAYGQIECGTPDTTEIATNYSLYYEDFKNESYLTALPYLRWILECAPGYPNNSDRNFERAVEAYEGIGMNSDDEASRRTYLDSALYIFDTAPAKLRDAGIEARDIDWKFDKARFIHRHAAELPDLQSGLGDMYLEVYQTDKELLQPITYYANFIVVDYVQKDMKAEAVAFMDQLETDFPGNTDLASMLETFRGQLFTSPGERIAFLESQVEKNPDDAELLTELFQLYIDEGMRDMVYEMAPRVLEQNPSARTYRMIARMRLDDGDTEEAIRLFEESMDMPGGQEGAKEVFYNIGLAHQQEGRLSNARTFYRRSLDIDPNYAQALIGIGDLYVEAVQRCSTFERLDRAVYWLATDYFDRAAARAESDVIRNQARQRASSVRAYFPTEEHKFFSSWTNGDQYRVNYGCYTWINETTTVR